MLLDHYVLPCCSQLPHCYLHVLPNVTLLCYIFIWPSLTYIPKLLASTYCLSLYVTFHMLPGQYVAFSPTCYLPPLFSFPLFVTFSLMLPYVSMVITCYLFQLLLSPCSYTPNICYLSSCFHYMLLFLFVTFLLVPKYSCYLLV